MKVAALLVTALCFTASSFAAQACSQHKHQTMSCAADMVWDAQSGTCVPEVTG